MRKHHGCIILTITACVMLTILTANTHAAIVTTGNVSPADPATWTSHMSGYVGINSNATMDITAGSDVIDAFGYIGYNSSSTGAVTVSGSGSTWTNYALDWGTGAIYVGHSGSGTLDITTGGTVSTGWGYIGYNPGSTGAVTVSGSGSTWTNYGGLDIGYEGCGSLDIADGGTVTVNKDTWLSCSSSVINFDSGTLTTGGLACELDALTGTGTINTAGLVSDLDLVFDSTHGLNQTFPIDGNPGQNITVNLDVDGSASMGAGYGGIGTISISDGVAVSSNRGYIGYKSSSTGTVAVNGSGSKWSNSNQLYVGHEGNATLDITDGASVSNSSGYICHEVGSTGTVTVSGSGSTWINDSSLTATYQYLYVGYQGNATLNITNGAAVSADYGYIGYGSESTSAATVDGSGSTWTNTALYVGYSGRGTLDITNGAAVSADYGHIGYGNSTSAATVDGSGSTWTNTALYVGYSGDGTLEITSGGLVSVANTLDIDHYGSDDSFINMAEGGMLALYDSSWAFGNDLSDFLALINGSDAINYWDGSAWVDITGATYGDDYTLEHISDGSDLDGYTVLTVNVPGPPDPDIDEDGDVDFQDFAELAAEWLEINCASSNWCNRADIDHSGNVGILDLQILANHWLEGVTE